MHLRQNLITFKKTRVLRRHLFLLKQTTHFPVQRQCDLSTEFLNEFPFPNVGILGGLQFFMGKNRIGHRCFDARHIFCVLFFNPHNATKLMEMFICTRVKGRSSSKNCSWWIFLYWEMWDIVFFLLQVFFLFVLQKCLLSNHGNLVVDVLRNCLHNHCNQGVGDIFRDPSSIDFHSRIRQSWNSARIFKRRIVSRINPGNKPNYGLINE